MYTIVNVSPKIQALIDSTQYLDSLPKYSSVGCYPYFYIDADNNVLCADCASKNDEFDQPLTDYAANWEDSELYCDHCSQRIESAYADDDLDSITDDTEDNEDDLDLG